MVTTRAMLCFMYNPNYYNPRIYLFTRQYSTDHNLQLQLSKDICYVHDSMKSENFIPSLTPYQLSSIQHQIENGSYKVGPLEYIDCLEEDMNQLLDSTLPDYLDIHIHVSKKPDERLVIIKAPC